MKLGVCLESFGLPLRNALARASKLSLSGVQFDAVGELTSRTLSATGRREFKNLLKTYNLDLSAIQCPLRKGLDVSENQQPRLEYIRETMALAFELGPRCVVVPCPSLPKENEEARANLLKDALLDLGQHGDRIGCVLALEIGLDAPESVRDYLAKYDVGSLKINYDPANLLMNGHEPTPGIFALHRSIAHVHARDARKSTLSKGPQEVQLGAGDIDWLGFIAALTAIDYRGVLAIERNGGNDPSSDIEKGAAFLRKMMVPTV
jgi:L-ribulose-5-phosphate 3-epimerase